MKGVGRAGLCQRLDRHAAQQRHLPAIAQQVALLRGISVEALAVASTANAFHALPRLKALLAC